MTKKSAQQSTRAYEKAHPETFGKDKARASINNKVRDGKIKKPTKCPNGCPPGGRVEWNHHSTPPGWGCSKCNKRGRGHKG
jgi:hypothetical protein